MNKRRAAGVIAASVTVTLVAGLVYAGRHLPAARPPVSARSEPTRAIAAPPSPGLTGSISEHAIPELIYAGGILAGSNGSLFVTGVRSNDLQVVMKLTSPTSFADLWTRPPAERLGGMTLDADGNLWITETQGEAWEASSDPRQRNESKVARITPSGKVTEFPVATNPTFPSGVTRGPDGNLWLGDYGKVLKITTGGSVIRYPLPAPSLGAGGIVSGSDGNLWFGESRRVAKVTTSGSFTEFSLPDDASPGSIAIGPNGNIWMTAFSRTLLDCQQGEIFKMTPSGLFARYPVPPAKTLDGQPAFEEPPVEQIIAGPDGNMWFMAANNLDQIAPSGVVTQFVIPPLAGDTHSELKAIAAAPDGGILFVGMSSNYWHIQGMVGELS